MFSPILLPQLRTFSHVHYGKNGHIQGLRVTGNLIWVALQVKTQNGASGTRINLKLGGPTGYDLEREHRVYTTTSN